MIVSSCISNALNRVCSKRLMKINESKVFLNGPELEIFSHFKHLGFTLDSNMTFNKHIKTVLSPIKFNLCNLTKIRPLVLTGDTAKLYFILTRSHMISTFFTEASLHK